MSQIDDLLFEVERRSILFHRDTSMPDATQLGYIGDPNLAVLGNTPGETLLVNCPPGTRFMDKTAEPYVLWEKVTNILWTRAGSGAGFWFYYQNVAEAEASDDVLLGNDILCFIRSTGTAYQYIPSGGGTTVDHTYILSTLNEGFSRWRGFAGKYATGKYIEPCINIETGIPEFIFDLNNDIITNFNNIEV